MVWFRYLKTSETLGTTSPNQNYSYPYLKRVIKKFTPKDTLSSGTWLFIDVEDLEIDTYLSSTLDTTVDPSSYLVVYEHPTNQNDFTPVKTIIYNNILYFQTPVEHLANQEISKQYSIYYKTPNLRYIKAVSNGGQIDYQVTTSNLATFDVEYSEVNSLSYSVGLSSSSFYNFSFINGWENGSSIENNAKLFLNFSGPSISIYGSKGPNFGKFKLRIIGLQNENFPINSIDVDWIEVDCYQTESVNNTILYSKNNLSYRDYNLELEISNSKNILSSSNNIKLSSYSFSYNPYLELETELITDSVAYVKIGGIR